MIVNELIAELLKMPPTAIVTTRAGEIEAVEYNVYGDDRKVMLWD